MSKFTEPVHHSAVSLAHPSGNQFFRHAATAFGNAGRLAALYTCLDWRESELLKKVLPKGVRNELARRSFSRDLGLPVCQHPWREAGRLAAARLGWRSLTRHETGIFSVDAVYRDFDRWVARELSGRQDLKAVYAYEDAAEATFKMAAKRGWRRIYDLPIAYWETGGRLLREEAHRWPDWEPTLVGTRDSATKLERKVRELALADVVICPSPFVADSVLPFVKAGQQVTIVPFGSPASGAPPQPGSEARPLRVLFAGSMSQRKGLADLFAAIALLGTPRVELIVLGSPIAPLDFYRSACPRFVHAPPRPHSEVLALMRTCDVFCLPSIVEGRALVIQEALSQGLPVIITPNTGSDDLIEDFENGFVVPIRSPEAIAQKLEWFLANREKLPQMGVKAQAAAARLSWADYERGLVSVLEAGT